MFSPAVKQLNTVTLTLRFTPSPIINRSWSVPSPMLIIPHRAEFGARLAMAEAAAHDASYLAWPTWPEKERARMSSTIRPEADFLRDHADLLNNIRPRADVLLFFPFREWTKTGTCPRLATLAVALTQAGIQYEAVCEDDFIRRTAKKKKPPRY